MFGAAVPKKLTRPPALEISATPNTETPHLRKLQRTIDPTAATPFRRSHIPVRMVIERDDNDRLADLPNPECGQVMKIARAVEQKWRKAAFEFAIKFLDQTRWRRKSKLRSPFMSIDDRQTQWLILPRVIEMEVQSAAQKNC